MTLPGNRPPRPSTPVIVSTPLSSTSEPVTVDDNSASHADYDLRPLGVRSLDHYVEYDDDERFHVR